MKVCILMGSFRKEGNTETLLKPFIDELKKLKIEVENINITKLNIEPCTACWTCQNILDKPGCPKVDDMNIIFNAVMDSDCIIFATPIYSWYCTPPMKAVLDRLVYGMNKFYGQVPGDALWKDKKCAIVTTCGYDIEWGAGPFEEGIKRYAEHSKLKYLGKLAARDIDDEKIHMTSKEVVASARSFAHLVDNAIR